MPRFRTIVVLLLLIAAGAAVWWWRVGRGPEVSTVLPTRGTAVEIVYATGAVEPVLWAKVGPSLRGRLVERCRCEGAEVVAGQLLARLDDREARATLRELEARRDQAQREVDRQLELSRRGVASTQAFERAQTELRQLEALIAAQTERVENYKLLSPIDGRVLRENGEIGEVVDTSAVLYIVGRPSPLQLTAEVNEEDIPRVSPGQLVLIRADAYPDRRIEGHVADITPAGDPVAKTYRVRIRLPGDTPLKIGMSVEANIVTREKADALLLPSEAVSGGAVYLVQGNRVVRRPVETGIRGTRAVEIVSGLAEGQAVISPAPAATQVGARVRPIATGAAAAQGAVR